jgi:hypothetical protein
LNLWLLDLALRVKLLFDGWDLGWGLTTIFSWLDMQLKLTAKSVGADGISFLKVLIIGNVDPIISIILVGDFEVGDVVGEFLASCFQTFKVLGSLP